MNGPFFKNEWRNGLPFIAVVEKLSKLECTFLFQSISNNTVKLWFKERLNKEQLCNSEPFPLINMPVHFINSEQIGISEQLCYEQKASYYQVRLCLIKVGILVVCCLILCILRHLACRNLSLWATIWSFISQGYLFWLHTFLEGKLV